MKSSEHKEFGDLLGQFRTEVGLTQQQLAHLMGKSLGTIGNWERGQNLPKERSLVLELAKHLRLDSLKRDQLLEAALLDPLGTIWTIPFQRNPFFTGREDILNHLQKTLSTDKTVALMQPQALKGLGGIGKTHTAIEYAYRHRDEYQAILWAPATAPSILQASLISIAMMLNLPQKNERDQELIVKAVKQWLMNHSGWLLILDNVEDLESVGLLYPWAHSGHVIITTRSQSVGGIALSISLEKMEPEEGALFLLRRATLVGPDEGKEQANGTDYQKAKELSEILGGLPLALDQAAAYIERTRCGLEVYLELYQIERAKLLSERGGLLTDHPESVAVTFFLAFQKVENASAAAGELLQFCAFLSPDAIPEEIITNGGTHLSPPLEMIATNLLEFNTAIGILLSYSLVRRDTDIETRTRILSVHRLVQAVLQDEMEETERQDRAKRVVLAVNAVFPHAEYNTWPQCERLLPHARLAAQYIETYQSTGEEAGRLLHETATYLRDRARYPEAEPLYQHALRVREQQLGPGHPDMASSLNGLGRLCYHQGKYTEAEPLHQRALRIWEQQLGPEHPDVTYALKNLGALYYDQGKYTEAELCYQRALRIWEQQLGPEHPDMASSLNGLGMVYHQQGKYTEAEPLLQRALRIWEQQLGSEHPDVTYSLHNLGRLYFEQGKYTEAELYYQRALRIGEQQVGPEHPDVAPSLNNLANLYLEQQKYEQAEPLLQRALHIREQQLGPEHPNIAYILNNLAQLYLEQEKYEQAEPLFQRALRMWEQQLGLEHPNITYPLDGLAILYFKQKKYEQAELLFLRALHIREQQLGPEHPETAEIMHNFALLQEAQNNTQKALFLYQATLAIREQALGPYHPKTTETRKCFIAFLQTLGQQEEAASHEAILSKSNEMER